MSIAQQFKKAEIHQNTYLKPRKKGKFKDFQGLKKSLNL